MLPRVILLSALLVGTAVAQQHWPTLVVNWNEPCNGSCATVGAFAAHDFNGDRLSDLVTASATGVAIWDQATGGLMRSLGTIAAPEPYALIIIPDINSDGVRDVVIGARNLPPSAGAALGGGVFILSGASGAQLRLIQENDAQLGSDVCSGDFDGDGLEDLLVGCANQIPGQSYARTYSGLTGSRLRSYQSAQPAGYYGESVCIGDLNGDRRHDHIVGAYLDNGTGAIYAYDGVTGNPILSVLGARQNSLFGHDVALVSDFDGDSLPDVLVGAPMTTNGATNGGGEMLIVSGRSGLTLRTFRASPLLGAWYDAFGWHVLALSDVDGDGVTDVMGSGTASPALYPSVWLFSGRDGSPISRIMPYWPRFAEGGPKSFDINGDGTSEILVGAASDTTRVVFAYSLRSPAFQTTVGTGCPAYPQDLRLDYRSTPPRLGLDLPVHISNSQSGSPTLAVVLLGAIPNLPGVDLTPLGMPGCRLHLNEVADSHPIVINGSGTFRMPIPRDGTRLCGATIYHQALALDVSANAAGISVSNYGEARIGF